LLRSQARDFLDRQVPTSAVRALMASDSAHDPSLYARMVDLGWTAIPFPEQYGGLGLGMVDMTVVLEELGRHVAPSPLISSVALAGMTLLHGGSDAERPLGCPRRADAGAALGRLLGAQRGEALRRRRPHRRLDAGGGAHRAGRRRRCDPVRRRHGRAGCDRAPAEDDGPDAARRI